MKNGCMQVLLPLNRLLTITLHVLIKDYVIVILPLLIQVVSEGHRTGRVATHQCCQGGTWYVIRYSVLSKLFALLLLS